MSCTDGINSVLTRAETYGAYGEWTDGSMALAGKIGISISLAAACGGLMVFGPLDLAAARSGTSGSTGLLQRPGCHEHSRSSAGAPASEQPGTQTISVTVPSIALLRTDHGNHIVAAMTNTGCAPRPGDQLFFVRPDGSVVSAPTTELAHRRWVGNFTNPGVYVAQTPINGTVHSGHMD